MLRAMRAKLAYAAHERIETQRRNEAERRKAVQDMANNKRLEVWLVPVAGAQVLVPFRILIGTNIGDLIVYATRFTTDSPEHHAMAE